MRPVVILSGGMDSAVLLHQLHRENGGGVQALSFDYGQRHRIELDYAYALCRRLGVEHTTVALGVLRDVLAGSSQTSSSIAVPRGHYTDESMKATVVPNRNMIMLAIATGFAVSRGLDCVAFAAHAGDHPIYPDCRPNFVAALQVAVHLGNEPQVHLHAPFVHLSKGDIARKGAGLGVPFDLTWSCYDPQHHPTLAFGRVHCGRCGTCVERREAFQVAGVTDPTSYAP